MREIDQLCPPSAGRLLDLWRMHGAAEPLERAVLCNAQVLAESCRFRGKPVFDSPETVLAELTPREMETLLQRLAGWEEPSNPHFDPAQFERLRED